MTKKVMSAITNTCLKYLIGISETSCDCYTPKPDDFNLSQSGIYLDQLAPLSMVKGLANCEDGELWDIYDKARTEGITKFIADVQALMLVGKVLNYPQWTGKIGEVLSKQTLNPGGNYSLMRLYCRDIRSGKMTIKKIGTNFSQSGTKQVTVMDNLGNIHGIYDLTTNANYFTENVLSVPLELPMHSNDIDNIEYYIVYQNDNNKPRDNKIHCNCGKFNFAFSPLDPYFKKITDRRYFWAKWVMCAGATIDNLSELSDRDIAIGATDYLYGLTVDADFECATEETICLSSAVFEHPQLYKIMAFCIRYQAAMIAVNKLFNSANLSRANMINRETYAEMKKEWIADYDKLISYIVANIDITLTDCFVCRENIEARSKPLY